MNSKISTQLIRSYYVVGAFLSTSALADGFTLPKPGAGTGVADNATVTKSMSITEWVIGIVVSVLVFICLVTAGLKFKQGEGDKAFYAFGGGVVIAIAGVLVTLL